MGVGAYSRLGAYHELFLPKGWALIRGWTLNEINTMNTVLCTTRNSVFCFCPCRHSGGSKQNYLKLNNYEVILNRDGGVKRLTFEIKAQ